MELFSNVSRHHVAVDLRVWCLYRRTAIWRGIRVPVRMEAIYHHLVRHLSGQKSEEAALLPLATQLLLEVRRHVCQRKVPGTMKCFRNWSLSR